MFSSEDQFNMFHMGVLAAQKDPSIDMDEFRNLEDLRLYLNDKLGINIIHDMLLSDALKEIKHGFI